MPGGFGVEALLLLSVIALFAGMGITVIGPGGVFVTIALYVFTTLPKGLVAGTSAATYVAMSLVGSAVYLRSGELRTPRGKRVALVLGTTSIVGSLVGVRANAVISQRLFGVVLGGFVTVAGVLVWYRSQNTLGDGRQFALDSRTGLLAVAAVGFAVGVPSGLLGVGGPVLAVPILVTLGVPLVLAVAVAQVQSVFIVVPAAVGYLSADAVSLPLVVLLGLPELVGVVLGWKLAHRVEPAQLKRVLAAVLVILGPYLALGT